MNKTTLSHFRTKRKISMRVLDTLCYYLSLAGISFENGLLCVIKIYKNQFMANNTPLYLYFKIYWFLLRYISAILFSLFSWGLFNFYELSEVKGL